MLSTQKTEALIISMRVSKVSGCIQLHPCASKFHFITTEMNPNTSNKCSVTLKQYLHSAHRRQRLKKVQGKRMNNVTVRTDFAQHAVNQARVCTRNSKRKKLTIEFQFFQCAQLFCALNKAESRGNPVCDHVIKDCIVMMIKY